MRPTFITTKGQRRLDDEYLVETYDQVEHYSRIYATKFRWNGVKNIPKDYIEKAVFYFGLIGSVDYYNEKTLIAGLPSLYGIHGDVLQWIPSPFDNSEVDTSLMNKKLTKDNPILFVSHTPMAKRIEKLCRLKARAYNTLNNTLLSMGQPVLIETVQGNEITGILVDDAIRRGDETIKQLKQTNGINAKVLDLQGKDYTQSLISTINALDSEILSIMGVKNVGTEKKSGVTAEETLSITEELSLIDDYELRIRQDFCERVKSMFPEISVELVKGVDNGYSEESQVSSS